MIGERSSGTNYLTRLIKRNLALTPTDAYGWKHGFPQMMGVAPDVLLIGSVRGALDWVLSMYAKPWHCRAEMQRLDLSAFLRAPWDTVLDRPRYFPKVDPGAIGAPLQQDRDPLTGEMFGNLLLLRRAKARALLGLPSRGGKVALLRMEEATRAPERVLQRLSEQTGAALTPPFAPVTRRLGARFNPAVPDRPAPPQALSPEDRAFVLSQLDPQIEAALGYDYA